MTSTQIQKQYIIAGFQMLNKQRQKLLAKFEYAIICILVLIAATSIVWSISIYIVTGDFGRGIIGAKLTFRLRDFTQLTAAKKEIFSNDFAKVRNETYLHDLELAIRNNETARNMLTATETGQTTEKPKSRKIPHLFQTKKIQKVPDEPEANSIDDNDDVVIKSITEAVPSEKPLIDYVTFLAIMTVDMDETRWQQSVSVQFIYNFPFLSEIIAIIWIAMCLIFQSGVKKYWGLPKPWRIVVPSIVMFTLMSLGSLIYMLLANRYLKAFCAELRQHLPNNEAISCGQAMSLLRPNIIKHVFSHDVYLNLFRTSYIFALLLWVSALLIMLLRFIFAIDFQVVEVQAPMHAPSLRKATHEKEEVQMVEVPLQSPQHQTKMLQVDERHKSEDDFQSAKSHLSEVVTPLLKT